MIRRMINVFSFWVLASLTGVHGQVTSDGCGGTLTADSGYIKSPNYPTEEDRNKKYEGNQDCYWVVPGQDTTLMRLRFNDLSIEPGEDNSNITCDYDYLNLTITSISSRIYCGVHTPDGIVAGMGSLNLHFHSDDSVNYRGFSIVYQKQDDFDPCRGQPCAHGDCEPGPDLITPLCTCYPGYTGEKCDSDINECDSSPCKNEGVCQQTEDVPNAYTCLCPARWEGQNCEQEKSPPCQPGPCLHGATCIPKPDFKWECICASGYEGRECEIKTGCGNPGIPYLNKDRRFNFDTILQYSCVDNYILVGDSVAKCENDGTWSIEMPDCIENGTSAAVKTGISPWVQAMIGLGSLVTVNVVVLVSYLAYKSPWSLLDRLHHMTSENIELNKGPSHKQKSGEVNCISARASVDLHSFSSGYLS